MGDDASSLASLRIPDLISLSAAIASPGMPLSLFQAIERIATARMRDRKSVV